MEKVSFNKEYKGERMPHQKILFLEKYLDSVISKEPLEVVKAVEEFREYCRKFFYDGHDHYPRYVLTYLNLIKFFGIPRGKTIVELGGISPITTYLSNFNECFISGGVDLRIEVDIPESFADIVLSFETIEHIKDVPEKSFDEIVLFNYSGVKNYVNHMYNILKPEGYVVLTTPNPCSFKSLINILNFSHPYMFPHHVREYTKAEIIELFKEKFTLIKYLTMVAFFVTAFYEVSEICPSLVSSSEERGDDQFFIFKKMMNDKIKYKIVKSIQTFSKKVIYLHIHHSSKRIDNISLDLKGSTIYYDRTKANGDWNTICTVPNDVKRIVLSLVYNNGETEKVEVEV